MRSKRNYREIRQDGRKHHAGLAGKPPDSKAKERFRKPAYQAGKMVRAQGMQVYKESGQDASARSD